MVTVGLSISISISTPTANASFSRGLASRLIEQIGDLGFMVAAFRIGKEAEGGWELSAHCHETGELWIVRTERSLEAAAELAQSIGIDLE